MKRRKSQPLPTPVPVHDQAVVSAALGSMSYQVLVGLMCDRMDEGRGLEVFAMLAAMGLRRRVAWHLLEAWPKRCTSTLVVVHRGRFSQCPTCGHLERPEWGGRRCPKEMRVFVGAMSLRQEASVRLAHFLPGGRAYQWAEILSAACLAAQAAIAEKNDPAPQAEGSAAPKSGA